MLPQDEYRDEPGSVFAADVYHSNTLMPLTDAEVIARLQAHIELCEPGLVGAQVVDRWAGQHTSEGVLREAMRCDGGTRGKSRRGHL